MSTKFVSKLLKCILLTSLTLIPIYKLSTYYHSSRINSFLEQPISDVEAFVNLNQSTDELFPCVRTKTLLNQYTTTVCVHNTNRDTDVSGAIARDGIWEEEFVTRILRILSRHPQFAFIDIGANLGIYTMYAAALGCPNIIAIECFQPNVIRIRRAIQIERVQSQVVLVQRAIYDKSNTYLSLRMNIINNIGSQRLNNEVSFNPHDPLIVKTIRFDDLLPLIKQRRIQEAIIKIDIEGSENYFCQSGEQIFNEINIRLILMEWTIIQQTPEKAKFVRDFFLNHNYIPLNPATCQKQLEIDYLHWNLNDIFWVKQNNTYLCQL